MTVAASTMPRSPVAAPTAGRGAAEAWHLRLVTVLVVLLVLTQRIGIPVGDLGVTSLAIPLAYGFVALSLARNMLVVSWLRAGLFTIAVSACLLTTAAVSWLGLGSQFSMSSLLLLITLYVPWVMRGRVPHGAAIVARAGQTFVWTMLALSAVGMAQLSAQLLGVWVWTDYLEEFIPADYFVPDYNYNNELAFGIATTKSTAFVMLEPSFLSQFCALAILVGIMLRVRTWKLWVLAGGLASAVSGTGLVLLAAGALLLLVRAPRLLRLGYVLVGVVVPVLVLRSPIGQFLVARGDEVSTPGTSGDARFVAPYRAAWEGLHDEPIRFLVGGGPGSVNRIIPGDRITINGTDVLYGVIPKLAFEYGILAGGLFVLFLLLALIDRTPWRVVPGALVVMLFLLSGALLQPQTAYLAWLLSGIGASDGPKQDRLASG